MVTATTTATKYEQLKNIQYKHYVSCFSFVAITTQQLTTNNKNTGYFCNHKTYNFTAGMPIQTTITGRKKFNNKQH